MTANSIYGSYIRVPTSAFNDGDPVDVANVRDGLVNNAIHLADECAQVRVNAVFATGSYAKSGDFSTGTHIVSQFGPFPITLRPDGTSYRLRTRFLVRSANGVSVTFHVVLAPPSLAIDGFAREGTNYAKFSVTSTTETWTAPAALLYMDTGVVNASFSPPISTPTAIGEATTTSVVAAQAILTVYATQASAANARLSGAYAAEFVG